MTSSIAFASKTFIVVVASLGLVGSAIMPVAGHDKHPTFSAGVPGNPKNSARVVKIIMRDENDVMRFVPDTIEIKKGEQIRFVISNEGIYRHEFMLATKIENSKHALLMKKYPDMEHQDPNGIQLHSFSNGEIIWKFTKRGEFEFACLIPGHYEAGMHGKVIVK